MGISVRSCAVAGVSNSGLMRITGMACFRGMQIVNEHKRWGDDDAVGLHDNQRAKLRYS